MQAEKVLLYPPPLSRDGGGFWVFELPRNGSLNINGRDRSKPVEVSAEDAEFLLRQGWTREPKEAKA